MMQPHAAIRAVRCAGDCVSTDLCGLLFQDRGAAVTAGWRRMASLLHVVRGARALQHTPHWLRYFLVIGCKRSGRPRQQLDLRDAISGGL